jgi:hypothetical protein
MYLLPLFLPFLNLVISCLLGKFLGKKIMVFFVINMAVAVLSSFFIFFEVGINKSVCFIDLGNWFHIGLLRLN